MDCFCPVFGTGVHVGDREPELGDVSMDHSQQKEHVSNWNDDSHWIELSPQRLVNGKSLTAGSLEGVQKEASATISPTMERDRDFSKGILMHEAHQDLPIRSRICFANSEINSGGGPPRV